MMTSLTPMTLASYPYLNAVRGATLLATDTPAAYQEALTVLMETLLVQNHITTNALVAVFFTQTPDLIAANPAQICRRLFDWPNVAMLCAVEPNVTGFPPRCLRVMVQFYADFPNVAKYPVYLNGAEQLRPDLA